MPVLTHLALLDGGAWHICFEMAPDDVGNIYYAFCQAIPGMERAALSAAVGGGWRVQASRDNARRLASLFPAFPAKLVELAQQLPLFTVPCNHESAT